MRNIDELINDVFFNDSYIQKAVRILNEKEKRSKKRDVEKYKKLTRGIKKTPESFHVREVYFEKDGVHFVKYKNSTRNHRQNKRIENKYLRQRDKRYIRNTYVLEVVM